MCPPRGSSPSRRDRTREGAGRGSRGRQEIEIGIVDNDIYEEDEQFLVRLSQVRAVLASDDSATIASRLGPAATATVLIVDDDHAGAFGFASEKFKVAESSGEFIARVRAVRGGEDHR